MAVYPQKGNIKQYWIMDYELFIKNGMFAVRSDLTSFQYALLSLKIKKKSVVHASHVYNYTLKMVLNCFFFYLKKVTLFSNLCIWCHLCATITPVLILIQDDRSIFDAHFIKNVLDFLHFWNSKWTVQNIITRNVDLISNKTKTKNSYLTKLHVAYFSNQAFKKIKIANMYWYHIVLFDRINFLHNSWS